MPSWLNNCCSMTGSSDLDWLKLWFGLHTLVKHTLEDIHTRPCVFWCDFSKLNMTAMTDNIPLACFYQLSSNIFSSRFLLFLYFILFHFFVLRLLVHFLMWYVLSETECIIYTEYEDVASGQVLWEYVGMVLVICFVNGCSVRLIFVCKTWAASRGRLIHASPLHCKMKAHLSCHHSTVTEHKVIPVCERSIPLRHLQKMTSFSIFL